MLPADVVVRALTPHRDERGTFIELHRREWAIGDEDPIQWNAVSSAAGVLRGVHVHIRHEDYVTVVAGRMLLGLHDIRRDSPTYGLSTVIEIAAAEPRGVRIPVGVCHGFYFPEPSIHVYAVSRYWNVRDELGCRYDSPELRLGWNVGAPLLSDRDRSADDYAEMVRQYEQADA